MSDERVTIRRIRSVMLDDGGLDRAVVDAIRELGPEGGDIVVIRATPDRAAVIERNLVNQLFTMGAHVAGPPVGDSSLGG